MLPFNYNPLDLSKRGIRLLRLLKSHAGPICCELFEVKVTDRGCDTPYEALSYVWGSPDLTHQIEVNGKELSITANLHVALSYLRLADTDRVLWVDAVCIDQNNRKKRGHQVQQMGDIYRQARQVVVWLGVGTSVTNAFMKVLQKLQADMESEESPYRNWVPKYDNSSQQYWYKRWIGDVRDIMGSKQPGHREHPFGTFSGCEMHCGKRGFDDIPDSTWFRRVWILQEVANASTVVVCCGDLSVPGLYFAASEDIIHACYGGARMSTDNGHPNLPAVNYEIPEKSVAERTACFIFSCAITSWARLDSISDLVEQLDWLLAACIAVHLESPHRDDLTHLPNGGTIEITPEHLKIPLISGNWTLIDKILTPSTAYRITVCHRKLAKIYQNCDFHVPESMRSRSKIQDEDLLYAALQNPHMGAHIVDRFWENANSKEDAENCALRVLAMVWRNCLNDPQRPVNFNLRSQSWVHPEYLAAESLAALVSQMLRAHRTLTPFNHYWKSQEGETLLGYAIKSGKISLAQKLLVLGANPKLTSMGWTPLMLAAMHLHDGIDEVAMTLLESGVDLHEVVR
ncbi:hypothetical protein GQ607_013148, partial [Colletotrichum asianum]